jgi:mannose-6-phosphate isomerase-like protein (cupin superfamily)
MTVTAEQLEQFVRRLVASPELWRDHVRHSNDVRVYEQIWDEDDINAWVICWSEEQDTGFHDHDRSSAAIAVISGHVREDRLTLGGSGPISRELGAGEVFTVPPVAIHRVLHAGDAPAVTIHAYSPPLTRAGTYRLGPNGELERESQSFELELAAGV